jgi:hypothetical protein
VAQIDSNVKSINHKRSRHLHQHASAGDVHEGFPL